MKTSNPRIYAAGDVTAENALNGSDRRFDLSVLPQAIFTDPQVATVGRTGRAVRAAGTEVKTGVLPLAHVPRSLVAREAGESIQILALAMKAGMTADDLTGTLFAYLTLSEGIKLAVSRRARRTSSASAAAQGDTAADRLTAFTRFA